MSEAITTAEYVLWAYRLLLGREPENPAAVESWGDRSREEVLDEFLRSREFLDNHSAHAWLGQSRNFWFIGELDNGTRFWLRAGDEPVSLAIASGDYRPLETAFVRRHVRRGMNCVDAGAGIGWFTVNMAMLVGPAGRVDAFEPDAERARYLGRTIAENRFGHAAAHHCALAAANRYGSPAAAGDATEAPSRRLDAVVWGAVHFIRIAVGGAEKLVLDGADLILSRDRPIVLSAIDNDRLLARSNLSGRDYVRFLDTLDYEVWTIIPGGCCGERLFDTDPALKAPILSVACLPAEKAAELTAPRR